MPGRRLFLVRIGQRIVVIWRIGHDKIEFCRLSAIVEARKPHADTGQCCRPRGVAEVEICFAGCIFVNVNADDFRRCPVSSLSLRKQSLGNHQCYRASPRADVQDLPALTRNRGGSAQQNAVSVDFHCGFFVPDFELLETEDAHIWSFMNTPSRMKSDLSHIFARSGSWVTITIVWPSSSRRRKNS